MIQRVVVQRSCVCHFLRILHHCILTSTLLYDDFVSTILITGQLDSWTPGHLDHSYCQALVDSIERSINKLDDSWRNNKDKAIKHHTLRVPIPLFNGIPTLSPSPHLLPPTKVLPNSSLLPPKHPVVANSPPFPPSTHIQNGNTYKGTFSPWTHSVMPNSNLTP